MTEIAWSDLRTKGYVVAPGFLSAHELRILADEFGNVARSETLNPNFGGLRYASGETRALFAPKLVAAAARATGAPLDKVRTGIFYSTRLGIEFDWHTDSSSYYIYPQYLNFWIPLVKPDRNKSGLSIVDFEAFSARCPELAKHFAGRGSTRVIPRDGKTVFYDNDKLRYFTVDDPHLMDSLAISPELGAGDLLLLRSDVFHRTQDSDTDRLAISFRLVDSSAMVTRQMLMNMGPAKFNNMARMRTHFVKRFATFDVARRDSLTVSEYDAIYYELEAREEDMCRRLGIKQLSNNQLEDLIYELTQDHARRA